MTKTNSSQLPSHIGPYQILRELAKGGMGEIFLALDPGCGRQVAIKRIRSDLSQNKTLQGRFLREAKIAAQLTHPSIIPIYAINYDKEGIYYTMPYVEGETLKQIIKATAEEEKTGVIIHPIGSSIPALMRIFLNVCQGIAYSHSRGILHRDLKPENIIAGKFGEVFVIDWGLADFIETVNEAERSDSRISVEIMQEADLTNPGKIPGTLSYLAPERVLGEAASASTDIYALGVILYQLLTLQLPFQRHSVQSFKRMVKYEKMHNPQEVAPYRDIPLHLADIAKRCLSPQKDLRFPSVAHLISEIESYIEGRPEWMPMAELRIDKKDDWEFQENIVLAKHIAITRNVEVMEWVSLMISRASFSGSIKLEAAVRLEAEGNGIGFLFSIPEASERKGIEDGYCLWIGSKNNPSCKLFRSNVEVMQVPHLFLNENQWHQLRIEKVENHVRVFLDKALILHYISHTPMTGTHIGLLYRDSNFEMEYFKVFVGSQNVMINCLAIPDAFLANKNFTKALAEYRRIGYSFSGRAEGREALFKAGITLLEEAEAQKKQKEKQQFYLTALDEFGKLRATPGAPLEYLGKSLVYKACNDLEEESKCLELAVRKYTKHPLLHILTEHIVLRLHEASFTSRPAAYHFALLALRQAPHVFTNLDNSKLLDSLKKNLEPLDFILTIPVDAYVSEQNTHLAIQLAFWLAKPIALIEIMESSNSPLLISNALFALLKLGYAEWAQENLHLLQKDGNEAALAEKALLLHTSTVKNALSDFFQNIPHPSTASEWRCLKYLCDQALQMNKGFLLIPFLANLRTLSIPMSEKRAIDAYLIWAYLLEQDWKNAGQIFENYPSDLCLEESSPFYFLMGAILWHNEGKEIALSHLSGTLEDSYPPTTALAAYHLQGKFGLKKGAWHKQALFWEKIQLYRQLLLLYKMGRSVQKMKELRKLLKQECQRVHTQYTYP